MIIKKYKVNRILKKITKKTHPYWVFVDRKCEYCGDIKSFNITGKLEFWEPPKFCKSCIQKVLALPNSKYINCLGCGKLFKISISRFNKNKTYFCCKKCYSAFHFKKVKCAGCGEQFKISLSKYNHNKTKIICCSKQCRKLVPKIIKCIGCNNEFKITPPYNGRNATICSIECYNKWKREYKKHQGESHRGPNYKLRHMRCIYDCSFCKKQVLRTKGYAKKRGDLPVFCSISCSVQWQNKYTDWNKGINNGSYIHGNRVNGKYEKYSDDFTNNLRWGIKRRDNLQCQLCNNKDKNLHVHHINYDKTDGAPDNLITLCRSCHTRTNHNREYWYYFFQGFKQYSYQFSVS